MSPHFPSDAGGRKFQCEVHSRFYETPFPHFQNCFTIQNKSEKNIHAMIIHTCKSKLNLFFLEPCISTTASTRFYTSSSSSIQFLVVFLSRYVLNQFQLRVCNTYPPPPSNFSTDLALCCGDWGGGAVARLRHCVQSAYMSKDL